MQKPYSLNIQSDCDVSFSLLICSQQSIASPDLLSRKPIQYMLISSNHHILRISCWRESHSNSCHFPTIYWCSSCKSSLVLYWPFFSRIAYIPQQLIDKPFQLMIYFLMIVPILLLLPSAWLYRRYISTTCQFLVLWSLYCLSFITFFGELVCYLCWIPSHCFCNPLHHQLLIKSCTLCNGQ